MTWLVPLAVGIPLVAAAALAAAGNHLPPRVDDLVSIGVAAAVTVFAVVLVFESSHGAIDYWFGGWHPRHGIAVGVSFHVEPLAAAVAATAGALTTASQLLAFDYFDDRVPQHYHVLMLVFLAAMVGFALAGDLFDMFVWFELMSIAGFALTGYRIEQPTVLQGAINFGVLNSIAAFLVMIGIALLYGRTGALNLQQLGEALRHHRPDGLVIVAFTAIGGGFLVKAGAFPFHFWLADAYSLAPAPVGVVFAGIMSDLGLHGLARVYWDVFSGPLGAGDPVRGVLLAVGVLTALVGAGMAFMQASLKRMMAFVTIAHIGVSLIGIALLTPRALAGATVYLVADGLVRGALYCAVAHVAFELRGVSELKLYGAGRRMPLTGVAFAAGALAVAAIPPFGPFLGRGLVSQSAAALALPGLTAAVVLATLLPGAALLRAFARVFLGIGSREDPVLSEAPGAAEGEGEGEEQGGGEGRKRRSGLLMHLPAWALLVAGVGLAFAPGVAREAVHYATLVERPHEAALHALHGVVPKPVSTGGGGLSTATLLYGILSTAGAVALAALALWWQRLPGRLRAPAAPLRPLVVALRVLHDGVTGEYVAWLTFGVAGIGASLALLLR